MEIRPDTNPAPDKSLWQQMRRGDKEAFSKIYQRHADALFGYGMKLTADPELLKDAVQDLFVEIWNNRAGLAEVENPRFYLVRSLRFKLLRVFKKKAGLIGPAKPDTAGPSPEDAWIDWETNAQQTGKLQEAILQLPQRQQEIIHLRYFQSLRHGEIASIMGINYQSVANLLHKSLCSLKSILDEKNMGIPH